MAINWNPWHGCKKLSPGCQHCYVYRSDQHHGRDASQVNKTQSFDLPIRRNRQGEYKIKSGELVWTCFTSDLLLAEADSWRPTIWSIMRERQDLQFFFITKRIDRFNSVLPPDWGEGYPNVAVGCTAENRDMVKHRLPIFAAAPIKDKTIICEPLLEEVDLSPYLGPWVDKVVAGGESGPEARICDYNWILKIAGQCAERHIPFWFKQTGAHFLKDGRLYNIPRRQQHSQASKAGVSTAGLTW